MPSLELLATLGAVQGLLLLILIAVRFRSRRNLPLALLLLAFSIRLGTIPYWNPDGLLHAPWIFTIVGALPLLFGPLVWWYVRELIREDLKAPRRMPLHVSPWLVETIGFVAFVLLIGQDGYQVLLDDVFTAPSPWWLHARNALKGIVGGAYAFAAARIVFGRESRSPHVTAARRIWARAVVLLPALCLLSFLSIAADPSVQATASQTTFCPFTVSAAIMVITVYVFAFLTILLPDVLNGTREAQQTSVGLGMDADQVADIIAAVEHSLATGVYRDPELSLIRLAKHLEIHPNRLSHAINRGFECTFTRLVNRARVDDFLQRVDVGDLERYTMLSLALDSGFRSKSTFNRVFKDTCGITPSEYLQRSHVCSDR